MRCSSERSGVRSLPLLAHSILFLVLLPMWARDFLALMAGKKLRLRRPQLQPLLVASPAELGEGYCTNQNPDGAGMSSS